MYIEYMKELPMLRNIHFILNTGNIEYLIC